MGADEYLSVHWMITRVMFDLPLQVDDIDENLIKQIAMNARGDLSPMVRLQHFRTTCIYTCTRAHASILDLERSPKQSIVLCAFSLSMKSMF